MYPKSVLVTLYDELTYACRDWPKCKGKGLRKSIQPTERPTKNQAKTTGKRSDKDSLSDVESEY